MLLWVGNHPYMAGWISLVFISGMTLLSILSSTSDTPLVEIVGFLSAIIFFCSIGIPVVVFAYYRFYRQ